MKSISWNEALGLSADIDVNVNDSAIYDPVAPVVRLTNETFVVLFVVGSGPYGGVYDDNKAQLGFVVHQPQDDFHHNYQLITIDELHPSYSFRDSWIAQLK